MPLVGTITFPTTGSQSIFVGFQPSYMRATAGAKNTGSITAIIHSVGMTDGTNEVCTYIFGDNEEKTDILPNKLVSVWGGGGTINKLLEVEFVTWTPTGVELNVTTANAAHPVILEFFE